MIAKKYSCIQLPLLLAVTMLGTSCRIDSNSTVLCMDNPGVDTQGPVYGKFLVDPSVRATLLIEDCERELASVLPGTSNVPLTHNVVTAEHTQYIQAYAQTVTPQSLPEVIAKLERIANNLRKTRDKIDPEEKEYLQSMLKKLEARRTGLMYAQKIIGHDAPKAWRKTLVTLSDDLVEDTLANLKKATKLIKRYPKLAEQVSLRILGVLQRVNKEKVCASERTLKHVISFLREALQRVPRYTSRTLQLVKAIVETLQDNEKALDNACIDKRLIDTLANVAERNTAYLVRVLNVLKSFCDHSDALVAIHAIEACLDMLSDHPQYAHRNQKDYFRKRLLEIDEYVQDHESKQMASAQQEDAKTKKDKKDVGTANQSMSQVSQMSQRLTFFRSTKAKPRPLVGRKKYTPASRGVCLPAIAEAP